MSCVIERVIYSEYDTSTGVNSIRARLICDDQSDLPAQSYDASTELMIGCQAHVIADGSEWEIDSSGSWVQQPSQYQLDLTGYATQSWVTVELAGYVDTTTYSTDQAAQDAAINGKASVSDIYGLGTSISSGTDLDTLTNVGVYYCSTAGIASSLINCPSVYPFRLEVRNTNGLTRYLQTLIDAVPSGSLAGQVTVYRRVYTASGWGAWRKFEGVVV